MEGEVRLVAPLKQSVATDLLNAAFVCCLLYFLSVLYCQDPSPVFAGFRCYSSPLRNTPPRTHVLSQRRLTKIVAKELQKSHQISNISKPKCVSGDSAAF